MLSDCKGCKLIGRIEEIAKGKFEIALRGAEQLRTEYFESRRGNQKPSHKKVIKEGVLKASAKLAA